MNNLKFTQTQGLYSAYNNNSNGLHPVGLFGGKSSPLKKVNYPFSLKSKTNDEALAAIVLNIQEKERKLIGQELHDNVNQILATVRLFIEMLHLREARDIGIRQKTVEYVGLAIEEIRKISRELVTTRQEEKGLQENIQQIVDDLHFSTPMVVEFRCSEDLEAIDPEKATSLFRIIQEQVKNILVYSQASLVDIDLEVREREICLLVKDNGVGFDPKNVRKGIGLSNIQERVLSHDGTIDLQSSKGRGCSLFVSLPRW